MVAAAGLLVVVASAVAAGAGPAPTAFLGIHASDDARSAAVKTGIASALRGNSALAVQAQDVTARLVEGARAIGVDCDPALDECLLQLAAACTVAQAVYGTLDEGSASSKTRLLTLRLAVVDGGVVRIVTKSIDADNPQLATVETQEAVAELAAPSATASLVVDAPSDSIITIDGFRRGVVPVAAPFTGLSPGQHFIGVEFPDGASSPKSVVLEAGKRSRVVALPRPVPADALVVTGWSLLGVGAVALGIAVGTTVEYVLARADIEDNATHYRIDRDFNDGVVRGNLITDQDHLTDLPTYGYPLYVGGVVVGGAGAASLAVGSQWSALFDPPVETAAP